MEGEFNRRFTWHRHAPAPFESAWSVFAKILALNHTKPKVIFDVICNDQSKESRKVLSTLDSSWVDFDRFSQALNVKVNQLKTCFLDQLGFSLEDIAYVKDIRICKQCLAKGYHCTLFCLPLIKSCPWHGCELQLPCKTCAEAVFVKGLSRNDIMNSENFNDEFDENGINLTYESRCRHIVFSEKYLNNLKVVNDAEKNEIEFRCNQFLLWWYEINKSNHHLAFFAKQIFSKHIPVLKLAKYLSIANMIAGTCPWELKVEPAPFHCAYWMPNVTEDAERSGFKGSLCTRVYKSIRRYIYNQYIRQHKSCLNDVLHLEKYQEQYLTSSSICSVVIAYVTWRMYMERFSWLEYFTNNQSSDYRLDIQMYMFSRSDDPSDQVDIATFAHCCLARFFMILDRIERLADIRSFEIEQWSLGLIVSDLQTGIFHEFINEDEFRDGKKLFGSKLIVYTDPKFLIHRAQVRCVAKIKKSILDPKLYTINGTSLFNYLVSRYIIFKVINIAEERKARRY